MKLLKLKLAVKKAWLRAKKFWWAIILGLLFLVVALVGMLTRNGAYLASLLDLMDAKRDAHEQEAGELERIREAENDEKNKRLVEHQKKMAELQEEFIKRGETLDAEKEAELKRMVDKGYNDPEKLARDIAEAFGLKNG